MSEGGRNERGVEKWAANGLSLAPIASETELTPRRLRQWGHQLADRVEDHLELRVVPLLQRVQPAGQVSISGKELPHPDERPHDLDVHEHRPFAPQHAREHRYSLLG